jgi:hypothetical protein
VPAEVRDPKIAEQLVVQIHGGNAEAAEAIRAMPKEKVRPPATAQASVLPKYAVPPRRISFEDFWSGSSQEHPFPLTSVEVQVPDTAALVGHVVTPQLLQKLRDYQARAEELIAIITEHSHSAIYRRHYDARSQFMAEDKLSGDKLREWDSSLPEKQRAGQEKHQIGTQNLHKLVAEFKPVCVDVLRAILVEVQKLLEEVRCAERAIAARIGIRYLLPTEAERALYFLEENLISTIEDGYRSKGGDLMPSSLLDDFIKLPLSPADTKE